MSLDETTRLLLQAHVDGELDAASALAFEQRLAGEPELRAARDRLLALRRALRDDVARESAPASLRGALAVIGEAPRRTPRALDWRLAAAACVVAAALGSAATVALRAPAPPSAADDVVSDHLRAVMAPAPFDVASSDQHTVKPWFTGRLSFAPPVFDLADEGFPLVGGRVDVVGGRPAATLVFRHGQHLISLTSQPLEDARGADGRAREVRGFELRQWTARGLRFWAASDVAAPELDAFAQAAQARLSQD